ncbi:MAG TPA: hypothetical protein VKS79_21825 [Gemmataceae bacterium]|nr:hypothetical protein [Gemmataceae bacterium]
MKRTVTAFTLLAALGGCMSTQTDPNNGSFGKAGYQKDVPGVVGPWGAPIARGANGMALPQTGVLPVSATDDPGIIPAMLRSPEASEQELILAGHGYPDYGPDGMKKGPIAKRRTTGGVQPPPYAGPQGAVAAVAPLPPGMPMMGNARSEIRFVAPQGMKVAWLAPGPDGRPMFRPQLEAPGRYNFIQGAVYRLRISGIANHPDLELYPTIEVKVQSPKTTTFLAHSAIPLAFTEDDFEQVLAGNLVTKVIYLPDPQFQELATAGVDELNSTRLEPGLDPEQEAARRGTVMLVVRIGNIDLEVPNTPGMEAPNPYLRPPIPPAMMPGAIPPGARPAGPGTLPAPKAGAMRTQSAPQSGGVILP